MYCGEEEEYVSGINSCEECDKCENCSHYLKEREKSEEIKKMRDSKFMKEVEGKLSTLLCMPSGKLGPLLDDFTSSLFKVSKDYMEDLIKIELKILVGEYFDKKIKNQLDKIFKKQLEAHVLEYQKDDKVVVSSIREKILNKIKLFLLEKEDHRDSDTENSLEKVISKVVNRKTEKALEELKKETIEKFNIEAMKTMMKGMAHQLGTDKKLMKILTSGDFEE